MEPRGRALASNVQSPGFHSHHCKNKQMNKQNTLRKLGQKLQSGKRYLRKKSIANFKVIEHCVGGIYARSLHPFQKKVWWCTPVISAIQEAEAGGPQF
jgi:hypothetical protein